MKLLIIDGNNLAHRVFGVHRHLQYQGKPTGLLFGFFQSLIGLKKRYTDHHFVIAWDSTGSERRDRESKEAYESGIIPSVYKASRIEARKDEPDEQLKSMISQKVALHRYLPSVKVQTIKAYGYEADDISYTLALGNKPNQTTIVTSDKDFYQVIDDDITIVNDMKGEEWDRAKLIDEFGFEPKLWVDAGAIMGDKSDEIHGAPDWGPKTTFKYVAEFGDMDSVITAVQAKPKRTNREESLLSHIERVRIARSLKQMDIVPNLPELMYNGDFNVNAIKSIFAKFGFVKLMREADWLV